jgi:hypothetical protein
MPVEFRFNPAQGEALSTHPAKSAPEKSTGGQVNFARRNDVNKIGE